jgi:DNA-binding GntR family transcriptional regulator
MPRRPKQQTEMDEPASAAEQAYAAIVDLILTQGLRPGERTSVYLLSERLGIGRTPVKEAVNRLVAEGLLSVSGRSGTTLKTLSRSETKHLFSLRQALEDFAAVPAAANLTPEQLRRLQALLKELERTSLDTKDIVRSAADFVKANVAFHAIIVAAAGNPFLDRLYGQLQMQVQIVTYLVRRGIDMSAARQRQKEHEDIVAALQAGDGRLLRRLLQEHAAATEAAILRAMPKDEAAPVNARSRGGARARPAA